MKSNKINITFALPNLLPGGAERVISYIAQNIDAEKFRATLLIVGYSKDASYDVKGINIIFLEKPKVSKGLIALFNYIKNSRPDIIVTAAGHLNVVLAYMSICFPKTKFIARETTVLSADANFFERRKFNVLNIISKNRFRFFDKVICQSQDMLNDIMENCNVPIKKLVVINNPSSDAFSLKEGTSKNNPIRYITIGRLSKEKGIPRILKILSKIDFPFHYTIIGDGVEKNAIFTLIEEYGLSDKITHVDFTKDVSKYLSNSDFFLQGSYFEGFPNCLIESCSVGTPVIAYNVPGGTKEIIIDGVNGYLVENEEEYIEKLKECKEWIPQEVRASVYSKFNSEVILKQYEDLFVNIFKNKSL